MDNWITTDLKKLRIELLSYSENVYISPPENILLKYPCIIIDIDDIEKTYADNASWRMEISYLVKCLSTTFDNPATIILEKEPLVTFRQNFNSDGVNHIILNIRRYIND